MDGFPGGKTRLPATWFFLACLCGLWSAGLRSIRTENLSKATGLIDMYWVNFYLLSYRDGYRRRALLGSITRTLSPAGAPLFWINILAFVVMFLIAFALCLQILRANQNRLSFAQGAIAFVLCGGGVTALLFETAGDPLQICVLVAIAAFAAIGRCERLPLRLTVALAGCALCILIHEASIFLMAPSILLVALDRLRLPARLGALVLILAVMLGAVTHWGTVQGNPTYAGVGFPAKRMIQPEPEPTPPFKTLLLEEEHERFKDRATIRFTFYMVLGLILTFAAGLILFASLLPENILLRQLYIFAVTIVVSAPLYVIAHDWGRFSTYTLFISLFAAAALRNSFDGKEHALRKAREWLRRLRSNSLALIFAVLAVSLSIHPRYIEEVMPTKICKSLFPLFVIALASMFLLRKELSAEESLSLQRGAELPVE